MARRPPGVSRSTRWLAGAAIAVVAVAAIVLSVAAIERVRLEPTAATPIPTFTFGAQSGITPSPKPAIPSPSTTPPAALPPAAEQRFLSVGSGGMWRATAGACGGPPPVVERSVDGGRTWTNVTPTYRGIAQVMSLSAFAGTEAEMVAAVGPDCEVQALRTFTQGEFWDSYPDVLAASTYVGPENPARLVTPDGRRPAPCAEPRSVRAAGGTIALVCDGIARLSAGADWRELGPAAAVGLTSDAVIVAGTSEGCDGTGLTRMPLAGGAAQPAGCAAGATGNIAIAPDGTSIWVWSADAVARIRP